MRKDLKVSLRNTPTIYCASLTNADLPMRGQRERRKGRRILGIWTVLTQNCSIGAHELQAYCSDWCCVEQQDLLGGCRSWAPSCKGTMEPQPLILSPFCFLSARRWTTCSVHAPQMNFSSSAPALQAMGANLSNFHPLLSELSQTFVRVSETRLTDSKGESGWD